MGKVYYLDYTNDLIMKYDGLYELFDDIMTNEDIIELFNDIYEQVDTPVGPVGMGDILNAFDKIDSLRDGEIDWWVEEVQCSLKNPGYYTYKDGEISYDKNLLQKLKEGTAC